MKTSIQKTAGSLFLILGISPLLIVLFFSLKEKIIQAEMQKKLQTGELQTVILPEKDVVWMDDQEIWVNESMFDIRTKELNNGVYTFKGMYDQEETELVISQKKMNERQKDDNVFFSKLFKFLQGFYYEHLNTTGVFSNNGMPIACNDPALPGPSASTPSPPPKKVC